MIGLIAKYHVQQGEAEAVLAALNEMSSLVKAEEPGCKLYQVNRSIDDPDRLLLYEQYENQAAVDFHRNTPHFQRYVVDTIIPKLVNREVEFYELAIS